MDEQEMIETAFDDLIKSLRKGTTEESVKMIRRAFEFAREAHQIGGTLYIASLGRGEDCGEGDRIGYEIGCSRTPA